VIQDAREKVRKISKALVIISWVFIVLAVLTILKSLFMLLTAGTPTVYDHWDNYVPLKLSFFGLGLLILIKAIISALVIFTSKTTLETFKPLKKEIEE